MDILGSGIQPANAPLYPNPPYYYRGTRGITAVWETDTQRVLHYLPPGVEPLEDPMRCVLFAVHYPFSTFGPYHEAILSVRVRFEGEGYLYTPLIYVDADAPLAAGREMWGWPKKLADFEFSFGGEGGTGFREQFFFAMERPKGKRLLTVTMSPERPVPEKESEPGLPCLTLRQFPSNQPGGPPSVSQLIRTDVEGALHRSADGSPEIWTGPISVTFDSPSVQDPLHEFAPVTMLGGVYSVSDATLPQGRVVKDYLAEETAQPALATATRS